MRRLVEVLVVTCVVLIGVSVSTLGKVKIVFSNWHLVEPHWEKALKEAIAEFMAQNPDIEVELEYVS